MPSLTLPQSVPPNHASFLERAVATLARDLRIVGVAAGGSLAADTMDEYSDLDLIVACDESSYAAVLAERLRLAESLGPLLAAFTGEHVFEPRLLICLFGEAEPLHVDLKFVSIADAGARVEDPIILWERGDALTRALARDVARFPQPDRQWIEDRFWVWVHYAATKIGRGELFEALDFFAYVRGTVLGPLALARAGARPTGVRKLESLARNDVPMLLETISGHSRRECIRALRACVTAYRSLRADNSSVRLREAAELAAEKYLARVEAAVS